MVGNSFISLAAIACIITVAQTKSQFQLKTSFDFLGKSYRLSKSCNSLDDLLQALGINDWFYRRMIALADPTITVTKNENTDYYTMAIQSTFKNLFLTFKLGKEFEEETPDGRRVKSVFTRKGNKLIQESQMGDDKILITVREFGEREMKATATVGNIKCTRIYKLEHEKDYY